MPFSKLRLAQHLVQAVKNKGFEAPTPIQEKVIPLLLQGIDVIGQAKTGTGKTAAFGLALLHLLHHNFAGKRGVVALILTPTRELAVQVADEINELGALGHEKDRALAVYGGKDIEPQIRELRKGIRIAVGTPGRVLDHLERGSLDLSQLEILVIDEADRMLDMGFIDDMRRIISRVPPGRQKTLFSATMPPEVVQLAQEFMRHPEIIRASGDEVNVAAIKQFYSSLDGRDKLNGLANLLNKLKPGKTIVFTRTKYGAERLAGFLHRLGFDAISLHGNMTQNARDRAMRQFDEGTAGLLVATDLAARGLDIERVDLIVNYDLPIDEKTYLHRIGRTGRAGAEGLAHTFVSNLEEIRSIKSFSHRIGAEIVEVQADTARAPFVRGEKFGREHLLERGGHGGREGGGRGRFGKGGERGGRGRFERGRERRGDSRGGGRGDRHGGRGSSRGGSRPVFAGNFY